MSRIDELIEKLCPDGVEHFELEDCAKIVRGNRVTKSQLKPDKQYPVISGGVKPLGYFDEYNREENTITIAQYGSAGYIDWQKERFWANDVCYSVYPLESVLNKYLFYVIINQQDLIYSLKTNAIPAHLPQNLLGKIKIPVPPLAIQEKIVEILDKFTQLETELETELEARKAQYQFYRNQLLTFENKEVEWKTLGEIGKVSMCKRIMKNETTSTGDIPFYKIGTFGKIPNAFIKKEVYENYKSKYSFPKVGTILISASGTIGRTVIYDGKPAYFQDSNIVWVDNDESIVTNQFLNQFYKIIKWETDTGGVISRLYNDNIKKAKIPVPSMEEQNRIVKILDHFDDLVNDISSGLPAEIKARRQQYEYYRAKLLTFKVMENH